MTTMTNVLVLVIVVIAPAITKEHRRQPPRKLTRQQPMLHSKTIKNQKVLMRKLRKNHQSIVKFPTTMTNKTIISKMEQRKQLIWKLTREQLLSRRRKT